MPLLSLSLSQSEGPKKTIKCRSKAPSFYFISLSLNKISSLHTHYTHSLSPTTRPLSPSKPHRKTNYPEVLFRLLTLFSFILLSPFLKAFSNNNGLIFPSPFCSVITLIYFFADSSERKKKNKRTNKETIFIQSYQQ